MTTFPAIPALHECPKRGRQRVFALCGDIYYPDGSIVPRRFKTDGASRPWFLRHWLKKFGRGFAAFIKHDYDYAMRYTTRREADELLKMLLGFYNFNTVEIWLIFQAVRKFGWISWSNNKRRKLYYFYCTEDELNNTNKNDPT